MFRHVNDFNVKCNRHGVRSCCTDPYPVNSDDLPTPCPKIASMTGLENGTVKNQESPDNAQNRPKFWDIYKKLGIRNGDIENQNGDVDATVKKVISSKNAQGCPKNWDIYKKLGMNLEEKPPIEKNTKRL